jgi:hypothetical protein
MRILFKAVERSGDVIIFRSRFPYIRWVHEVTLVGAWNKDSDYVKDELRQLRKIENCKHQNKEWDTVNHPGGEVGRGLICLDCGSILKYE